jgi:hypothetical protein
VSRGERPWQARSEGLAGRETCGVIGRVAWAGRQGGCESLQRVK